MNNTKNILLTMIAPILWGTTYIITSTLIPIDKPFFVALMRGLPVGSILLLYYKQFPKGVWILKSIILGTLNIGGFFAFLFIAAYRLPGGIAAILGSVQPIFCIILSWLLLKEKPNKKSYIASIMTILGVALLVLKPTGYLDPLGIVAALIGAVSMASGVVLTKYWGRPVNNIVFTSWQLFYGSLILIPITFIVEGGIPSLNITNIFGLVLIGVLNTGLAYALWFNGISKLSPTQVTFLGPLSPLTAFLLGFIFLKQTISYIQIVGVSIILTSVYFSQLKTPSKKTLPSVEG
ncbi:DMT family transporter [Tepidibacter aestuarii]|uniref:DMT family transporter n=1 Tax=Tepidibacter aestuarii TaxID=2925782 RepID=UPI0020BEAB92|nr:EamA family transporter [Tepidibacter aestuarii]CAH2215404.1 Protein PecM [Tepidibacter aestuarii]